MAEETKDEGRRTRRRSRHVSKATRWADWTCAAPDGEHLATLRSIDDARHERLGELHGPDQDAFFARASDREMLRMVGWAGDATRFDRELRGEGPACALGSAYYCDPAREGAEPRAGSGIRDAGAGMPSMVRRGGFFGRSRARGWTRGGPFVHAIHSS